MLPIHEGYSGVLEEWCAFITFIVIMMSSKVFWACANGNWVFLGLGAPPWLHMNYVFPFRGIAVGDFNHVTLDSSS